MPGGDELVSTNNKNALAAILFLAASTNAMDVYSALNSSPWTAENFGADPAKAKSCTEYVWHAIGISTAFGITSSLIAHSWVPIIGVVVADGYMYWLYDRALKRGMAAGTDGWLKS
jgi:hypothetical protein